MPLRHYLHHLSYNTTSPPRSPAGELCLRGQVAELSRICRSHRETEFEAQVGVDLESPMDTEPGGLSLGCQTQQHASRKLSVRMGLNLDQASESAQQLNTRLGTAYTQGMYLRVPMLHAVKHFSVFNSSYAPSPGR